MKYLIVTLIKDEAGDFQQKLLYDISEKFGVTEAIKRRPPAHITLKYSFETEDITPIENCIKNFCKTHKKCSLELKEINNFDKDVIFIDVVSSKEMIELYREFIEKMKKLKNITFNKFDGSTHFHMSIAHTDIKDKFDDIFEYAKTKAKYCKIEMDNISILELVEGVWKVHKEFELK